MTTKAELLIAINKHKQLHHQLINKVITTEQAQEALEDQTNINLSCPSCYQLEEETTIQFENFWAAIKENSYISGYTSATQHTLEKYVNSKEPSTSTTFSETLAITFIYKDTFWQEHIEIADIARTIRLLHSATRGFLTPKATRKNLAIEEVPNDFASTKSYTSLADSDKDSEEEILARTPPPGPSYKAPPTPNTPARRQILKASQKSTPKPLKVITGKAKMGDFDGRMEALLEALEKMNEAKEMGGGREYNLIKVDPFDGEGADPMEWLQAFSKAAQANNWSENRKLLLAPTYLRKSADGWYRALEQKPEMMDEFGGLFLEQFQTPAEVIEWRRELELSHQKNRTVDQYAATFRELVNKVHVGEIDLDIYLHQFIRGLRPEILENGPVTQATSLDEAIQAAKIAEATLQYITISRALEAASNPSKKSYTVN